MKMSDFTTIGASAHSTEERQKNDFYATDPKALEIFLDEVGLPLGNVWECACGEGHLARVLRDRRMLGRASDLFDRGYGDIGINFYEQLQEWNGDILTNPPYSDAVEFCKHALQLVPTGRFVVMLMRIQFLEGQRRKPFLLSNPLRYVYVSSSRLLLAKNGDFIKYNTPSANCYAWFVWQKGYRGDSVIRWFN
jgi:hypothetical protein